MNIDKQKLKENLTELVKSLQNVDPLNPCHGQHELCGIVALLVRQQAATFNILIALLEE